MSSDSEESKGSAESLACEEKPEAEDVDKSDVTKVRYPPKEYEFSRPGEEFLNFCIISEFLFNLAWCVNIFLNLKMKVVWRGEIKSGWGDHGGIIFTKL